MIISILSTVRSQRSSHLQILGALPAGNHQYCVCPSDGVSNSVFDGDEDWTEKWLRRLLRLAPIREPGTRSRVDWIVTVKGNLKCKGTLIVGKIQFK